MNKVIVKIAGIEYPIAGEETIEYLQKLGEFVNKEVENITKNSKGINLTMATTLAAINIADLLIKNGSTTESLNSNAHDNEQINRMEFKLQEKDVQIEALTAKLEEALTDKKEISQDEKVQEIMNISNEFQNRIFELQQEVEMLKNQLEKAEK